MGEQHKPLQGYPTGLMRLVIDRTLNEAIDLILTTGGSDPIELEIAQTQTIDGKDDGPEVILRGVEIKMLRDFLNSGIVSAWLEQ